MLKIAHRGLLYGPNPELENRPDQIELALSLGYDVEVDVWRFYNSWKLGHDGGLYPVSQSFLERDGLWIHCKNREALTYVTDKMHYFWHQEDHYTLTSRGIIWAYPGHFMTNKKHVDVLPELKFGEELKDHIPAALHSTIKNAYPNPYGMCSDYFGSVDNASKEELDDFGNFLLSLHL